MRKPEVAVVYPPPRSRKVFAAAHVAAAPGPAGEPARAAELLMISSLACGQDDGG